METHHVPNPWQQQQQQRHYKQNLFIHDPPDTFPLTDAETRSHDDFFEDRKKIFYQSKLLLQRLQQQEQLQLNHNNQHEDQTDEDGETDSQSSTLWSPLGMESPLNESSSTLADLTTVVFKSDSGIGLEGDVLESLVQTLQSEVKDSQATAHDLEGRLNLAEHSNKHIIEELKMLLADAEATLRNAGKSHSFSASGGRGSSSYEDSNIVYNRICIALQALIDEAQQALQKNSTKHHSLVSGVDTRSIPNGTILTSSPDIPREHSAKKFEQEHNLTCRGSDKNTLTLLDPLKVHDDAQTYQLESYTPASFYSPTDEVARIYWRQKHEEQHDRYRKSSQRVTLELEGRFQGLSTDSDDSEASFNLPRHSLSRNLSVQLSHLSTPSTLSSPSTPSTPTTPTPPLQGILRSSKKDGSRKERLKKKYQVQFLNPDVEGTSRENAGISTTSYRHEQQPQYLHHQQQSRQLQRQYTSRSVGSTRSRGVVLQLYDLWQQTWLRTRIMHVITGSVEIVIIIWVVIKASRITLTWFGVQPSSVNQWITFIYGHRDSAGAGAKELYAKIRKDGLQMRQIKGWSLKEPVELVEDLVAGATTSTGLISPSNLVYGPAKRVMAHAVTGVALAFFSDGARRLVRKL
ncbi:hypothetical protein BGX27_011439 [Mortierella sp. AM989]|nr:hypothetical protein BGX27_011439 [Mortierella sp. AM989]